MAAYVYRCPNGHTTELILPMTTEEIPATTECMCDEQAARVFLPPAAIHFKGPGFYQTDVKGKLHRKRRPNPGDKLTPIHDPQADYIARHL